MEGKMPEFVNPFIGMTPGRKMSKQELLRALRLSLSAEEEAVHIYASIADATDNELAKAVLIDIADEERVHKGEFQRLIEILSPDEIDLMKQGATEVDEIREKTGNSSISGRNDSAPYTTIGNLKQ
jgi:rubrerythrin